jgi:hypothetical protein
MTPDEYIRDRLDDQITWYDQKSGWNQKWFKRLRIVEIVFATTIPFLVSQVTGDSTILKSIVGGMGVCVAVLSGLITLYKFHENWIEYRTTTETLKHEKYLYLTGAAPYDGDNPFEELVNRVESIISRENTTWACTIKAKAKEKNS